MSFIGSIDYYVLCITALIILVLLLIKIQRNPKIKQQNTRSEFQQDNSEHIPKYAAGDDMDKINRKAYALWSEKKFSLKEIPVIIIGIILLIAVLASEINPSKLSISHTPTVSSPALPITPITTPSQTPKEKFQVELNSAEFNSDYSKIFVTYTYTNDTNSEFYFIITTINLKDENENILQSKVDDSVDEIKAKETKEITVPITITPENIGKIRNVNIHTTYQRR